MGDLMLFNWFKPSRRERWLMGENRALKMRLMYQEIVIMKQQIAQLNGSVLRLRDVVAQAIPMMKAEDPADLEALNALRSVIDGISDQLGAAISPQPVA